MEASGGADPLAQRIHDAAVAAAYQVSKANRYVVIKVAEADQHYWSPQLQITLEEQDDGQVLIGGLFTPMPAVWSMLVGIYAVIAVLGFFATIYGLAQQQLGNPTTALWAFPISCALIVLVYVAAMIGQRIGHEQTDELTAFLERCVEAG